MYNIHTCTLCNQIRVSIVLFSVVLEFNSYMYTKTAQHFSHSYSSFSISIIVSLLSTKLCAALKY